MNRACHALRPCARRMDHPFSADQSGEKGRRGIAEIASVDPPSVAFPYKHTAAVFLFPGKCFLNAADRTHFLCAGGKQTAFHGEGPEDVNNDRKPVRLLRPFYQAINLNLCQSRHLFPTIYSGPFPRIPSGC